MLLLTLASLPALVIFTQSTDAGMLRFVSCLLVTWCLMALMVIAGIWFPARQAMKIQPAEALHEE